MTRPYVVNLVPGQVRPAWCDRCLTSSAVQFDVYAMAPDDTHPGQPVAHAEACQRCDPNLFQPDPN